MLLLIISRKRLSDLIKHNRNAEDTGMKTVLKWIKGHKLITGLAISIVSIGVLVLALLGLNKNYIVFSVENNKTVEIEYGSGEEMEAVTAVYKGTIFNQKGTSVEVSVEGQVEYDKIGSYELSYFAKYKDVTNVVSVTVVIKDIRAPEITLVSNPEHYTSPVGKYQEEGFTATDNYDGDVTANVVSEEKDGKVIYKVADSSGNETIVERTIVYKDVIAPVITLKGASKVTLYVGDSYSEAGYSAADECDGDITEKVTVEGTVNANQAGTYTVSYKVTDSSGNLTETKRTVKVKNVISPSGDKVIYLTFDDGPSAYTEQLLNVLDKYKVKATFFVTGANPSYYHLIGEAYRRGHTIAVHTFSHRYNEMYASVDAYLADFEKIRNIIVEQTGEEPWLLRFPGGTSNTVSKKYSPGIMTTLVQEMLARGYEYCDWNVSSGDAGGSGSEQSVINNVINGCSKRKSSIVLQHDIKRFSVNAVDDIIKWGLANGYTFKAIDKDTALIHYKPNN